MRYITAFVLVLVLILPAMAQKPAAPAPAAPSNDLEQQLLKALEKYEFKAKRDVPAADSIFVEKGKLQEAMYKLSMQQGGVLLKSGKTTKVSSVKIMDRGVQVFFETDKCAMINMAADSEDIAKMSLPKLIDFTKGAISALFQIIEPEAKPETKPTEPAK